MKKRPKPTRFHRMLSSVLIWSGIGLLTITLSVFKITNSKEKINQSPRAWEQKIIMPVKIPPQGFGIGLNRSESEIVNFLDQNNPNGMNIIPINDYANPKEIPLHARNYVFSSLSDTENELDALTEEIQFASIDFKSITEENFNPDNLLTTISDTQKIVLSRILHFVIKPSVYLHENFGVNMAKFPDIYVIPQNNYTQDQIIEMVDNLRSVNAKLKIFLEIASDDKDIDLINNLKTTINGVWIDNLNTDTFAQQKFIKSLLKEIEVK